MVSVKTYSVYEILSLKKGGGALNFLHPSDYDLSAWHVHKVYLHPTAMKTSITVFYVNRNKVTLKCFG